MGNSAYSQLPPAPAFPTGGVPTTVMVDLGSNSSPIVQGGWSDKGMNPSLDKRAHNHYFKNVSKLEYIDVYRVLSLFSVTDPCIQHAVKKLLVAGGRGAGKDVSKDIQESIDSLVRWQEMQKENV